MHSIVTTVGHSNLSWDRFRQLIEQPDIGCIIDIRTSPVSRWAHFSKWELRVRLNQIGISYLHLGDQLGGRPMHGPADYEIMARSAPFLAGIAQVLAVAARCRPALLCSEHEPLQCHRCLLVGRHLVEQHGIRVEHILRDGSVEPHQQTEERLLAFHGGTDDLFQARSDRLAYAYRWQARRLGVGS